MNNGFINTIYGARHILGPAISIVIFIIPIAIGNDIVSAMKAVKPPRITDVLRKDRLLIILYLVIMSLSLLALAECLYTKSVNASKLYHDLLALIVCTVFFNVPTLYAMFVAKHPMPDAFKRPFDYEFGAAHYIPLVLFGAIEIFLLVHFLS